MIVFCYGTLMKGRGNHHFLDGAIYLGVAHTSNEYALNVAGLPFMQKMKGKGVVGELYEVNSEILKKLDRLEGHPTMYTRTPITVTERDTGHKIDNVQAYLYNHVIPTEYLDKADTRSF